MKGKERKNAIAKIGEKLKAMKSAPTDSSVNSASAETLSKLEHAFDAYTSANSSLVSLKASYEAAKKAEEKAFAQLHAEFKILKKQSKKAHKPEKTKKKGKKSVSHE